MGLALLFRSGQGETGKLALLIHIISRCNHSAERHIFRNSSASEWYRTLKDMITKLYWADTVCFLNTEANYCNLLVEWRDGYNSQIDY